MRRADKLTLLVVFVAGGCGQILIPDLDAYQVRTDESGGGGGAGGAVSSSSSTGMGGMSGDGGIGGSSGSGGAMGGAGGGAPCTQDSDCPTTNTVCASPHCDAGMCGTTNAASGTACSEGAGTLCDGNGTCVECITTTDCPTGTACQTRECNTGTCSLVNMPARTEVNDPTPGDCMNEQCDAAGMVVIGSDDLDVPIPADQCKVGSCSMGAPMIDNATMGTPCGQANTFCDGMGKCVGCTLNIHCGQPTECSTPNCTNMTCGDNFTPNGTVIAAQTPNDCKVAQCNGMGGIKQVDDNTDLPLDDGNPCTENICTAGMPSFSNSSVGTPCNQNGGAVCDGNGMCVECNVGADCLSGVCAMSVCQPPEVVSIAPADMAMNASVMSSIVVTFSGSMNATSLVGQTSNGLCTGSVQISVDDFVSCYGFASTSPNMSPDNKIATFVPAPGLSYGTTYKIKVTTAVRDTSGTALASDVTQTTGFATEVPQSTCDGSIVISQFYTAGGTNGAAYSHDFVELHNRGGTAVNLVGWSMQYASGTGAIWQAAVMSGMIAPGGYFLVQFASGGGNGMMLPTPDTTSGLGLSANAGKIALVSSTGVLTGGCPSGPQVRDFIGYGAMVSCFEGAAPASAPAPAHSIHRIGAGCTDTDQNDADTTLAVAAPRNTTATPFLCDCPIAGSGTANESNSTVEMDFCNVQFPVDIMVTTGQMTPPIFGRVFEGGFTEDTGADAAFIAEVGFGPANINPTTQSGYQFSPATYNAQVGNNDEYMANFTAPAPGSYRYVYRFTRDGVSYTYCDKNGAGANAGLSFDIHELPVLTVMP